MKIETYNDFHYKKIINQKPINYCVFVLLFIFISVSKSNAQILKRLGERLEQKAKDRANRKIDEAIDKKLDRVENSMDGATQKNDKAKNSNNDDNGADNTTKNKNAKIDNSLKVDSKFDFVPGEKVVLIEDFMKDNIGDFPDKWNTNGSGEVVTTNKAEGRFLETKKEVTLYPEWIKSLPDNFTLEFDLLSTDNFNYYSQYFMVGFTSSKNISKDWRAYGRFGNGGEGSDVIQIGFHPNNAGGNQGLSNFASFHNGTQSLRNEADQNQFMNKGSKNKVHVAIWRQKQRVRVYLNDKKIWDIPKAIDASATMNSIFFRNDGADKESDAFYFGNVRVAVGQPDTRNKLITEGKFSTSGILFDVNSDKIKAQSYGTIKDIANVLIENSDVKVKIIGHTDSDGDDTKNLELSKKRAEAVKSMLSKDFNIDANRMQTDGKGETQPLTKNDTPENKAQNRRVEFVKQ